MITAPRVKNNYTNEDQTKFKLRRTIKTFIERKNSTLLSSVPADTRR